MSRSSEIRTQRWKAQKAREQQMRFQEDLLRQEEEEEDDDGAHGEHDYVDGKRGTAALMMTGSGVNPENVLPLMPDVNEFYNLVPLLASAIKATPFYKRTKINSFNELVDEIYLKVTHLDPYDTDPSAAIPSRPASNAFCLLYKAFEMKLTKKQMQAMLNHLDSPFIRAIGALYLRYVGVPAQLFDWLEPLFHDQEEFRPERDQSKQMTVAQWARSLLAVRYRETILPRIPVPIEKQILAKLAAATSSSAPSTTAKEAGPERRTRPMLKTDKLQKGLLCRAVYWEDKKWYDVRVEEPGSKEGTYWVTYLPEEEYGNQEEVSFEDIRVFDDDHSVNKAGGEYAQATKIADEPTDEPNPSKRARVVEDEPQERAASSAFAAKPAEMPRYDEL